jgi:CheY-like chemotaxis protein
MVISGGLDMLARQPDPARWRRITDGMRQAVDRGAALTRQLLAFARRQPLKPEPVALDRRICEMEELLTRSLRGDIRVEMDFATDLWPVMVDPVQLELAVLNLAVNARDAMPNGGVLTIRAENAPALAEGEIAGDFVRLSVADNGTGMSAEIISRAFEPFFTTKDVGHGSGLGLAQIYGFARQSGGVARIDSAVGRGTTVTLLLARSAVAPAPPDRPSQTGPGGDDGGDRASRANVLLVEDDDEVAALTADMIGQLGYDVTRVANAAAALGALANGRIVDIVFSDVMMPGGMSGADLAREIGRRRPGLPVLMTTGYDGRAGIGADDLTLPLLRKPYRLEALAGALSAALELRKRKTLDTAAILRHES